MEQEKNKRCEWVIIVFIEYNIIVKCIATFLIVIFVIYCYIMYNHTIPLIVRVAVLDITDNNPLLTVHT